MRRCFYPLLVALVAAPALGHDLWLIPPGPIVHRKVLVEANSGMEFPISEHAPDPTKFLRPRLVKPDGDVGELLPTGQEAKSGLLRFDFAGNGVYVAAVQTEPKLITLEAEEFNHYLVADGLPHIYELRREEGTLDQPARERYSKSPKVLMQFGAGGGDPCRVLGLPLEIVPLADPFALKVGQTLRVRVLFQGEPLNDAHLGWDHPGDGPAPSGTVRTNDDGEALIPIDKTGLMTIRLTHMTRPKARDYEWESFWTTLTFRIPDKAADMATASPAAVEEPANDGDAPNEKGLYAGFGGYARKITTTSLDAQRWFDQGIQLLYGFNHDEAIRSFEQAAKLDPSCAMAWWGAAYARGLHINNPEMGEEQSRLADEAATKAVAALDDESEVEHALVHAVRQRYALPVPKDRKPLDEAYAAAMAEVWRKFPDDPDVGALYAESLMNLQPWDLWTTKAAPKGKVFEILAVLERTLEKTPKHPGANHFYIHAIEASPWPEQGTAAAERLGDLVPGSGHLVHMPSHIFMRTGRYADAAAANERAIAADEAYFAKAPKPEFYSVYYLHNVHFLAYAAMMEGRSRAALDAARKIDKTIPPDFLKNYVAVADGFTTTALHVLIRFGEWEQILAEPEPEEWRLLSRAMRHYARSVALSNLGRTDDARKEIELMNAVAEGFTDEWKMGNNPASDVVAVARNMAEGELAYREGEKDKAFELLRTAVSQETNLAYDEPPGWMQPVAHALGALLLAEGRADEAAQVYRDDLERHPGNAWSLLGLKQSLEMLGQSAEAGELAAEVKRAWSRADVTPLASCYCHPAARETK